MIIGGAKDAKASSRVDHSVPSNLYMDLVSSFETNFEKMEAVKELKFIGRNLCV